MDLGYVAIAIFAGILGLAVLSSRGRWNGKHNDDPHTPLKGHRKAGSDPTAGDPN